MAWLSPLADIVGILSLPLTFFGFVWTLMEVRRARESLARFKSDVHRVNLVAELGRFVDGLRRLKHDTRNTQQVDPARVAELRHLLITCRQNPQLSENQRRLQTAVTFLATLEDDSNADLESTLREFTRITDLAVECLTHARETIGHD
jgi:hypothetical protein